MWMRRTRARGSCARRLGFAVMLTFASLSGTSGQDWEIKYASGQNIAAAYEGWEQNPDGTFNLVFGYLNRNYEEQPYIPVGPNNNIEPGGPDYGQPTHFYPRRIRFFFRVPVPKDFGTKELVWTLTLHGKTERAYATLKPEYALEPNFLMRNYSGGNPRGTDDHKAPRIEVGTTKQTVKVGEPLSLAAFATDDGLPKPTPAAKTGPLGRNAAFGLRVSWFVYRGPGDNVRFDPEQIKIYHDYRPGGNSPWTPGWAPPPLPADGKFPVQVTFGAPGTYVVRAMAHDGGLGAIQDVTVTVVP